MLTEKQKENRKRGIGASESAIVLGVSPYMSPYELWLEKTGRVERPDLTDKPAVYWGTIHEETIAQEYARVNNCNVRRVSNTIFHKRLPFMLCHLDRKIEGLAKLLECKFAVHNFQDIWGETGSDIIPLYYMVQVQHQLACTGYLEGDLAVLIGGYDFRQYPFKRDEDVIKAIEDGCTEFWGYVERDEPPPPRDRNDIDLMFPKTNGNFKEADADILQHINSYCAARSASSAWEKKQKEAANSIVLFIKEHDGIICGSEIAVRYQANKNGKRSLSVREIIL